MAYKILSLKFIGLVILLLVITGASYGAVWYWQNQQEGTNKTGTLIGQVTIGPNCPVEREGVSCTPSPEAYASREFIVLNSSQKEVTRFHADSSGSYSISLLPGTYTVVSAKTGFGSMSKDLPATVVIKSGQSATLNIDIDTGIR